jgi:ribokinase
VSELWPYVLPLPKKPFDQYRILLSTFGSEVSLEVLRQLSSSGRMLQSELIRRLPCSGKTAIRCLDKLVSSGILESGMERKRLRNRNVWVRWYAPTTLGKWFSLLLSPRKVTATEARALLTEIFEQYSRSVAKLSSELDLSGSSLLSTYHGAFINEIVQEHRAVARNLNIVVFGSIAMDQIIPVEKFTLEETTPVSDICEYPGGSAAAVAVGLSRLGLTVGFAGRIGCDSLGQRLVEDIAKENVDLSQLVPSPELKTLRTVILVGNGGEKRVIVPTSGVAISLDSPSQIEWRRLDAAPAIYLGEVFLELSEFIAGYARSRGKPVFYRLLTPYAKFGAEKLSRVMRSVKVLYMDEEAWRRLQEASMSLSDPTELLRLGPEVVAVTRSAGGCSVYTEKKRIDVNAPAVEAIDSTGAGDAFAAAFTKKMLEGSLPEEAARYASAAAALSTTKIGAWASMPTHEEVSRFMS